MTTLTKSDVGLVKHLLRRASFGATPAELDHYEALGYEDAVEELLHPGDPTEHARRHHQALSHRYARAALRQLRVRLLALPHGNHESADGREGRALLARRVRHGLREDESGAFPAEPD